MVYGRAVGARLVLQSLRVPYRQLIAHQDLGHISLHSSSAVNLSIAIPHHDDHPRAVCLRRRHTAQKLPDSLPPRYSNARIWFSTFARPLGSLRRFATAQRRLPSRLPAPVSAVMSRTMRLKSTFRPRMSSAIGPMSRCRIEHVLVTVATGMEIVCITVVVCPAPFVSVPVSVPTAASAPF